MKKITAIVLLVGLTLLFVSCGGRSRTSGVYHHYHGYGPWWGSRAYHRDIIVVPEKDPPVEATPLPSGPEQMPMPDMGAPDFGGDVGGDMGGDMGGDW
jgi:hypothetical protein